MSEVYVFDEFVEQVVVRKHNRRLYADLFVKKPVIHRQL